MKERKGLTAWQLKLIAIAAMTLDHFIWILRPGYDHAWWVLVCHILGRLTAPIMWFFIAEGFHHTRNVRKYALRLFALAAVSHFTYNFCFGIPMLPLKTGVFNQTGVVWSLAWGLVLLAVCSGEKTTAWKRLLLTGFVCIVTFPCDWSCIAAMAVLFMGMERGNFPKQMLWMMVWTAVYALVYILFIDPVYGVLQLFTCLSIPLLAAYNGQKGVGKWGAKLFYWYYPAHLAVLGLLRIALWGIDSVAGAAHF